MSKTLQKYTVDVVIPCFHEEEALPKTIPVLVNHFRTLSQTGAATFASFRLILVDDGSRDGTWGLIESLSREHPEIFGVRLTRNYGHQAAMLAGLEHADADAVLTMDADLQDDIRAIDVMLNAYENGADLALGVRSDRTSDSFFKRAFANGYYKLLARLGAKTIDNHADFRLISRRALKALLQHQEVNLFFRGLIPNIGFVTVLVPYSRQARELGTSKYTIVKMLRLAIDGITSFSIAPLRFISLLGAITFFVSLTLGVIFTLQRLFAPETVVPGWTSTVLPLLVLGGLQILTIGILGEYIGKIYLEVKRRPRFIVQQYSSDENEK